MPCFVYVIGSRTNGALRTYVGWTTDLDRRLEAHNNGTGAKSTRGRRWTLLYAERFETRGDAMSREWHLKRDRAFRRNLALASEDPDFANVASGLRERALGNPDETKRNPGH
jgi:putative endonuclease